MNDEFEITNRIAIDTLQNLIADRTKQLINTPAFLEQERENLEMEIQSHDRHLRKIQEVQE